VHKPPNLNSKPRQRSPAPNVRSNLANVRRPAERWPKMHERSPANRGQRKHTTDDFKSRHSRTVKAPDLKPEGKLETNVRTATATATAAAATATATAATTAAGAGAGRCELPVWKDFCERWPAGGERSPPLRTLARAPSWIRTGEVAGRTFASQERTFARGERWPDERSRPAGGERSSPERCLRKI
jgi:hypothetical protein